MFCKYCGTQNPDQKGLTMCMKCGASLAASEKKIYIPSSDTVDKSSAVSVKPFRGKRSSAATLKYKIIAAVLVVAILVGGTFGILAATSPSKEKIRSVQESDASPFICLEGLPVDTVVSDKDTAGIALSEVCTLLGYDVSFKHINTVSAYKHTYYRFAQYYSNIPVYGKTAVIAADESGKVISLTSNMSEITGEVDLTPTSDYNQVLSCITEYISASDRFPDADNIAIDRSYHKNERVLVDEETGIPNFVYEVPVYFSSASVPGIYTFLVDAGNPQVISAKSSVYFTEEENGTLAVDSTLVFPISYDESEKLYYLRDKSRGISVYNLDHSMSDISIYETDDSGKPDVTYVYTVSDSTFALSNELAGSTPVTDEDTYFFSKAEEVANNYDHAARLYCYVISASDFYKELDFNTDLDLNVYYNDARESFAGIYSSYAGVLSVNDQIFEKNVFHDDVDIVAHEYTHFVTAQSVGFSSDVQPMSSIVCEAYSDIFGVIIESKIRNTDPDWKIADIRNLSAPKKTGNSAKRGDRYDTSGKDPHKDSTYLSHAAYLMWNGIDGNENMKIETSKLTELWYRSLLMMPPTASPSQCRTCVETAAQVMLVSGTLTDAQAECVSAAFNMTGVQSAVSDAVLETDDENTSDSDNITSKSDTETTEITTVPSNETTTTTETNVTIEIIEATTTTTLPPVQIETDSDLPENPSESADEGAVTNNSVEALINNYLRSVEEGNSDEIAGYFHPAMLRDSGSDPAYAEYDDYSSKYAGQKIVQIGPFVKASDPQMELKIYEGKGSREIAVSDVAIYYVDVKLENATPRPTIALFNSNGQWYIDKIK